MQCSDLERYLEAYLDLRLGRSRGAILRRHLSACPQCRARVEHLRAFERDLQRSFRAMERAQSVWTGLEPDLVRSGGLAEGPPALPFLGPADPPRRASIVSEPVGRRPTRPATRPDVSVARTRARRAALKRWGQRAAGLALLLAASLGATALMWRSWSGESPADPGSLAYAQWRGEEISVQFATSSPENLHGWLAPWLGEELPPLPAPSGFELVGGTVDEQASPVRALIVYRQGGEPTLLLVWPGSEEPTSAATSVASGEAGLSQLRWSRSGFGYAVVSPLPEADLLPFSRAEAEPL
jgi:anti-sigma factor RsiW